MTGPGDQFGLAGNPSRPGQEMLKNCIDAINNNGGHSGHTVSGLVPQFAGSVPIIAGT